MAQQKRPNENILEFNPPYFCTHANNHEDLHKIGGQISQQDRKSGLINLPQHWKRPRWSMDLKTEDNREQQNLFEDALINNIEKMVSQKMGYDIENNQPHNQQSTHSYGLYGKLEGFLKSCHNDNKNKKN